MLKPAQLYEDKLKEKMINCWYDPRYKYYTGWVGGEEPNLPKNCYDSHNFVSVDKNDNVIGYISYNVYWITLSASNFGAINFDIGNPIFAKDVISAVRDIFEKYHLNRLYWYVVVGNPAYKSYKRFVERCNGRECGYFRQNIRLIDGTICDEIGFEILKNEYFNAKDKFFVRPRITKEEATAALIETGVLDKNGKPKKQIVTPWGIDL